MRKKKPKQKIVKVVGDFEENFMCWGDYLRRRTMRTYLLECGHTMNNTIAQSDPDGMAGMHPFGGIPEVGDSITCLKCPSI